MKYLDLVKFVMCTLVSRIHMTFYILTEEPTVPVMSTLVSRGHNT